MRIALSIFTLVFFLQSVNAQQYPDDTQYQSIATPNTPAIPDYGQTVTDNSVPSPIKITRITEAFNYKDGDGNPQVWYPTHEYSKTQVWNIDQTRYKIGSWKVYDATTYQEEQELSSVYPCYWSNTDPDIIWSFRVDGDIKKYNVSTNTTQVVFNIPGYEFVKLGPGEANIDKNDHFVALVGKKANKDLDVIVFDLQTNQIAQTLTFANGWGNGSDYAPQFIDWVSVSQSGDYVVIVWTNGFGNTNGFYTDQVGNNHFGVEVYNRANMQFKNRIADVGSHGDLGYAVDGDEVFVQFAVGESGVYMQKLNGTGSTQVVTEPNYDFFASGHISCRNINRPGWAYVTQTKLSSTGQIVAVKLDETNTVEHFGHHFSNDGSYDQAPMAVASPNGDKVCFKSDFGTAPNDGDVTYDFIATLAKSTAVVEESLTHVSIYPNPANDYINIDSKDDIKNIIIYNGIGEVVNRFKGKSSNAMSINIKHLKKGIYFLRISTEKEFIQKKIIKF